MYKHTLLLLVFCFLGALEVEGYPNVIKDHPISVFLNKKSAGKYELILELPANFGFQKEAPHRILLSGKGNVVVKKADLRLNGSTHKGKPEYFEYVKAMPVELQGQGELEVNAKLFYCDFKKNICIPAKISESLKLP